MLLEISDLVINIFTELTRITCYYCPKVKTFLSKLMVDKTTQEIKSIAEHQFSLIEQ